MLTNFGTTTLLTVFGLLICQPDWASAQGPAPADAAQAEAKAKAADKDKVVNRLAGHRAKLSQRINLEKGIDANTPLKDALEFLASTYDLTIILDEQTFEAIGIQKAAEVPVQLPKMMGIRLSEVLRMLASQVKGDIYSGGFLIRTDGVVITTTHAVLKEVMGAEGKPSDILGPQPGMVEPQLVELQPGLPAVVNLEIQDKALREALRELADREGLNIVLDARVGDKAKTPVSATLNNVLAGTAVRLLADMADLKVLVVNNVLYVTTKENARELEQEQQKRQTGKREQKE